MSETATVMRGMVLLDRRRRGRLVQVGHITEVGVHVIRVDEFGLVKAGSRWVPVPPAKVEERFFPYRPCRWALECLAQATATIGHSSGDIDACAGHAAEYQQWLNSTKEITERRNWDEEPVPGCWCTDIDRETGFHQRYCPQHGTPQRRGTSMGELVLPSGGAGPVLEGPDRGKYVVSWAYADA